MNSLIRLIPAPLIRTAGQLQFRFPALRKPINFFGQLLAGDGVIQRGAGKGLRFNARGCNPGYLTGTSEPLEQETLVKYAIPGAVVYDLGANAGFYAVIAARAVAPGEGVVYAFEPTPSLATRARGNAAMNNLRNLFVVETAISNQDGTIGFNVSASHVSNSIRSGTDLRDQSRILVKSIRLDTFAAQHRPPNLLLIDIEGAEIEAIESGLQTISRYLPVIMVEVHWLGRMFIDFFEKILRPLGYTASTYDGQPLVSEPIRYHALLVPQERLENTRNAP
jgi:FkbM family methyltransferase